MLKVKGANMTVTEEISSRDDILAVAAWMGWDFHDAKWWSANVCLSPDCGVEEGNKEDGLDLSDPRVWSRVSDRLTVNKGVKLFHHEGEYLCGRISADAQPFTLNVRIYLDERSPWGAGKAMWEAVISTALHAIAPAS